jgi:uncharacterized Fe-S center protein
MSTVYFVSTKVSKNQGLTEKLVDLINKLGLNFLKKDDLVAVKLHIGEKGCTSFINPLLVRQVVNEVKKLGAKPFLTDTNALYRGCRQNAVDHCNLAEEHGFINLGAPFIVADGLNSTDYVETEVNLKHFKKIKYASGIHYADALICLTHFKGHMLTSFGGTLKNIGMGIPNRSFKQVIHSEVKPLFRNESLCTGCGRCMAICPSEGAIKIIKKKAHFYHEKCIGCAECITICPENALKILWDESPERVAEKIVEAVYGILKHKKNKVAFLNFLLSITPDCDCFCWSDNPIVPDIGILASFDPVAIDQASVDLVNQQRGLESSVLEKAFQPGEDKFRDLQPERRWEGWLDYAQEIGLGEREYELYNIESGEVCTYYHKEKSR